jgi:hypothetical protein
MPTWMCVGRTTQEQVSSLQAVYDRLKTIQPKVGA